MRSSCKMNRMPMGQAESIRSYAFRRRHAVREDATSVIAFSLTILTA